MTKINKLVLHGFKSFAKRTELVFENGFNCVLGPNGSGKSNILDALCFVLGKSSAKALRSEKSANLIYNGGKSKKPAKSAEVSIYFCNEKGIFPTEDKEVKVSRIVKPKGNSVYKINDETRTRQQILELLSLAKINPDSYNIILQGDIVSFVEMAPEERRKLIEEISGVSVYEEKKQKAINELNKVEDRLKESEIILHERNNSLKELRKERDQATKFKDLHSRIKINKASLLNQQIERKNKEKGEIQKRIDDNKTNLDKKQQEIDTIKDKIKQSKERIDEINKEIETKGEKDQVDIHKEVEKLKVNIASSGNRVESLQNEISKIKDRKKQLKQNQDEITGKIKKLEEEKTDMKKQIDLRENEQQTILKKIEDFKKKNNLDDAADIEKQIDTLDKEAEEKQKQITEVRQQQQEFLREKDRIEFQIQAIDEKIDKVMQVAEENKAQIEELKEKKTEFKKSTLELNKILNDDSSMASQLANARGTLIRAQEELSKLKAKSITIQETLGADLAIKEILKQKNKFSGVYGTVSELGQVSNKYSMALEIAAGHRIKSIVVSDDKVASQCIRYLKEKRLGIATFLPLNKIKSKPVDRNALALKTTNGVNGLAIDLISYDNKFKNVFSYVFGNTLVIDNIDVARRIGIGKAKMVTLEGDLAEVSGAMQGGYRKRKSKGLGFQEKEVVGDMKKFEKEAADSEMLVFSLEKKKNENEEKIVRLRGFKANLEGDIIKLEKSLNLDSGDIDASKKVKIELKDKLKKIEKEFDSVQNNISEMNKELAQNRIKRQEFRNKINELRNPALIAELNAFEEKRSELKDQIMQKTSEMKNFDSQIVNILNPEVEDINKVIKQHEKEEMDFTAEIKRINDANVKMDNELKDKEKKQARFHEQFKGLFNERTKIDENIKKEEVKIEAVYEQHRKVELRMNTFNLETARLDAELASLENEFKEFEGVEVVNKPEAQLRKEIGTCEGVITRIGNVNMKSLEIYDSVVTEYETLMNKKEKLILEKEDVLIMMNEIELKKKDLFMETFDVVNQNFKNIFSALSTKGDSSLVLEDPEKPFDAGLLIKVKLSGTRFMDIRGLSGGEKTMTALAFIFAIQEHDPASFYVLDEVDAALDKRNSERLAQLIRNYTGKAQYVVISHNDGVISEADVLYGISMNEHGVSAVTSLKI